MNFYQIEQGISQIEQAYFNGAFSDSVIRDDLQTRKAMDTYSTFGSTGRQTNELAKKKDFYIRDFNDVLNTIDLVINWMRDNQPGNSSFITRCENCKTQINKLLSIVRSF